MARAMATRCCSPPLSFTGGRSARFFRPTISRYLVASRWIRSQFFCFRISGMADVLGGGQPGEKVIVLKDKADLVTPETARVDRFPGSRYPFLPPGRCRHWASGFPKERLIKLSCRFPKGQRCRPSRRNGLQIHIAEGHGFGFAFAKPLFESGRFDGYARHVILGRYRRARSAVPFEHRRSWKRPR